MILLREESRLGACFLISLVLLRPHVLKVPQTQAPNLWFSLVLDLVETADSGGHHLFLEVVYLNLTMPFLSDQASSTQGLS